MRRLAAVFSAIGPGLVVAATGVGAGDMVSSANAGAAYGYALAWAAVLGAGLKFVLNEGLARWQLATGTTLLEGWVDHLGPWVRGCFLAYLLLWTMMVGAALMNACGLAGHALAPWLPFQAWAVLHSLACAALVLAGGYQRFEPVMGALVAVMFTALVTGALAEVSPLEAGARIVAEAGVPPGSVASVLGLIGGVGGSLTLLSYGYWIREKGWSGPERLATVRTDLAVAYGLTGLFGLCVVVLSARVLHSSGQAVEGARGVVHMAALLGSGPLGPAGHWIFLVGFWAAVATSMLGVWQSVPYLFCDFVALARRLPPDERVAFVSTRSPWYRGYLAWIALAPMALLLLGKPVALILAYAVVGALFMPFLAGTLLVMNSRAAWMGSLQDRPTTSAFLLAVLGLFLYLTAGDLAQAAADAWTSLRK